MTFGVTDVLSYVKPISFCKLNKQRFDAIYHSFINQETPDEVRSYVYSQHSKEYIAKRT